MAPDPGSGGNERNEAALKGLSEEHVADYRSAINRCREEARIEDSDQNPDPTLIYLSDEATILISDAKDRARSDSTVLEQEKHWQRCASDAGFNYEDPDALELAMVRRAQEFASVGDDAVSELLRDGMTESELASVRIADLVDGGQLLRWQKFLNDEAAMNEHLSECTKEYYKIADEAYHRILRSLYEAN